MTSIHRRGSLAALPALLVLGACTSDLQAPATDDQLIDLDVAQYVAEATNDDIVLMTSEANVAMQPGFDQSTDCQRVGLFRLRCHPRVFWGDGQLTISREVTFYDTLGNEMSAFDPLATDSINFVVAIEGTTERSGQRGTVSMTVNRQRNVTVSGLGGTETARTWNGTGSADVNRTRTSDEHGDRVYDMSSTTSIQDVVIQVPRADTWPLSGTITRHVSVQVVQGLDDPRTRERTVMIEFNGTHLVPITINGVTHTLDLETRRIVESG